MKAWFKLFVVLCLLLISHVAEATLTLDGNNSASFSTVTITTVDNNDLIIVFLASTNATGCTGIGDQAGLTWINRVAAQNNSVNGNVVSEWYAISSGTLSADVITPTGCPVTPRIVALGVNGANLTCPYDTNASLPGLAANSGTLNPITTTISTTNPNTFVVQFVRVPGSGTPIFTTPTGYTAMVSAGGAAASYYKILSSPETSVTEGVNWGGSGQGSNPALIVDAINDVTAGCGVTSPYNPPMLFRPF